MMWRAANQHLVEPDRESVSGNDHDREHRNHDDGQKQKAAQLFGFAYFVFFIHLVRQISGWHCGLASTKDDSIVGRWNASFQVENGDARSTVRVMVL
jgi:hypothetical protein